ncbi:MAG TPA: ESX secretion-associated protein EspG [Pseudonocardiaceae bacterium]
MPIVLEQAEFNVLWRRLELGARPLILNTREQGFTVDEARFIDQQAWQALAARGLVFTDGSVHPDLEDALQTLATPAAEVDLRWAPGIGQEVRAMAVRRGDLGVVAMLDNTQGDPHGNGGPGGPIYLDVVRDTAFVDALVGLLPDTPPGPGSAVSMPSTAVEKALRHSDGDDAEFEAALMDEGVRPGDARLLVDMVGGERLAAGQIGAAVRDRWGKRTRAPWVVALTDTHRGRYAMYERGGWITVAPVSRQRIVELVRELLQSV